jgi:hypothetical protein
LAIEIVLYESTPAPTPTTSRHGYPGGITAFERMVKQAADSIDIIEH